MAAVRILVDDVDEALAAYEQAGFTLSQRWGPPFAIVAAGETELWISGDVTSAAELTARLPTAQAARARVRPVLEVDDLDTGIEPLLADGWAVAAGPITGPGGSQLLLGKGSAFLEVFAG